MSDESPAPVADGLPEAVVDRQRGISIIWLIPLVAALVGGWLAYKTITESGPTITITFEDASGLEAGKTKIKYKSVTLGEVKKIELKTLKSVTVTAKIAKSGEKFMTDKTRFWIVRPRIGGNQISGLETLVSGAYISVDPRPGEKTLSFIGLEKPPGVLVDEQGAQFTLHAKELGSSFPGTPILHRGLKVGRVVDYKLAEDGDGVLIDIFIEAPYHKLVRKNSRFWQKSGIDVSYGTDGLEVNVASLSTLITGGIAFETPMTAGELGEPMKSGAVFQLFKNYNSIGESRYVRTVPYLLHFDGSMHGLKEGAPVEFRGIKIGSVTSIEVLANPVTLDLEIPVVIAMEPERLTGTGIPADMTPYDFAALMVERGMRAQLKTGNLLTGQLYVELDFHPDLPRETMVMTGRYPEIPTVPATIDRLKDNAVELLAEIRKVPFQRIGEELTETLAGAKKFANSPELLEVVHSMNTTLAEIHKLTREDGAVSRSVGSVEALACHLDDRVASLSASIDKTLGVIRDAMAIADPDSPAAVNLTTALDELSTAARSIRGLANYLEQHPEALLQGKKREER